MWSPFLLCCVGCIHVSQALSLKPSRTLKDGNILSLYLMPTQKGRMGCKDGRTAREGYLLTTTKKISSVTSLLWANSFSISNINSCLCLLFSRHKW